MHFLTPFILLVSTLTPTKSWFAPDGAVSVKVAAEGNVRLVMTNFSGAVYHGAPFPKVSGEKTIDLKELFPPLAEPGAYVLYVVPENKPLTEFVGTPLVVEVRADKRGAPGPVVISVQPLRYAVIQTAKGPLTAIFYYDVAPHTVDNFTTLADQGYYNGLKFHRIIPGFVLQGGDPKGDGSGGPGYTIMAEFNDRLHEEGVLSMARLGDPGEQSGQMPRSEFANSAGSQFFVCLDYEKTKHLDRKYTAFGKVVDGMAVAHQIEKTPLANQATGAPAEPQVIEKVEIKLVTPTENPYAGYFKLKEAALGDAPTTQPAK